MEAVGTSNDVLIKGEILVIDPGKLRRVIGHEGVREMIDAIVVNSGEIPWLGLHQCSRDRMN